MKRVVTCLAILIVIGLGVGGYFTFKNMQEAKRIEEIKKGWYVEITYDDPIKVRVDANTKSDSIGEVNKGEVYKVLDINMDSSTYFWYKIEFQDKVGWIASGRKNHWVKDVNNPIDIATPIIKFYEDVYYVANIKDINYKHLEVIEDTDNYKIEHIVYHEVKPAESIDQYWILYIITDGAGKSSQKMQKIVFEERPSESEVEDFANYVRK